MYSGSVSLESGYPFHEATISQGRIGVIADSRLCSREIQDISKNGIGEEVKESMFLPGYPVLPVNMSRLGLNPHFVNNVVEIPLLI